MVRFCFAEGQVIASAVTNPTRRPESMSTHTIPTTEARRRNLSLYYAGKNEQRRAEWKENNTHPTKATQKHTNLHQAIIAGNTGMVMIYMQLLDVNQPSVNGLTPLHMAVYGYAQAWKRAEANGTLLTRVLPEETILNHLLKAGADVTKLDDMGRLPVACLDGARMPAALASRMEEILEANMEEGGRETFNMRSGGRGIREKVKARAATARLT